MLRQTFNTSGRHLRLFPSIKWECLSTILLSSGLSLSPSASQSFLKASFYRFYTSLCNLALSSLPKQAGFGLVRSTLDQILHLFHCISDEFNKPGLVFQTILVTIDFSKVFNSVWHPTLFHKLISTGLPSCFARWMRSFLSDGRACVVFQNHKSRSFRVRRGIPQESVLGPVLFFLFLSKLPASLPSFIRCSFMPTTWLSGPPPPRSLLRLRLHKEL